ncbi:MAG: GDSL-type esterase/lipase family protein [Gaiellaceae bacterium]|jgi:lysophospholipase L1-like esterase
MTKTILCYGDSNTWGYVPGSEGERFPWEVRWPGVLQTELGSEFRVIEEGLSGRTTVLDNPLEQYRNGREYLLPCLQSHQPLDLVVIFLGTNDLCDRYSLPPLEIARGAALLAQITLRSETGPGYGAPAVLLCSLPRLGDTSTLVDTFASGIVKAADLPRFFEIAASEINVPLLDLSEVTAYDDADGVHLNAAGHRAVALAVARAAGSILGSPA